MTAEQGADFAGSWEKEASKTGPLNGFVRKPHCKLRKERGSFCSRSTVGRAVPNTPEKSDQMRTVLPNTPCAGASHCASAMLKEYSRHSSDKLPSTSGSQVCRATLWKAQVPAPLAFDADAVGTVSRCLKAVEVESAA